MSCVTIIIPCYNEAHRLPLQEYKQFLSESQVDLLFVNDGSSDETLEVLESLKENYPEKVNYLHIETNMGKAEAVRRGMLYAKLYGNSAIIGFIDADLSTPFQEIRYFLEAFADTKVEFVFGSRIARIGANINRFNYRHYFSRAIATLVSMYLKIPIYDSQCGAKFFLADFVGPLFMEPFVSRWLFDVELFKRIAVLGIEVNNCAYELPLHTWVEKGGSKINFKDYLHLPFEFYKIVRYYSNNNKIAFIQRHKLKTNSQVTILQQSSTQHF
jgi:dolichyl-phosphate beta-glucosyltransferase